MKTWSKEEIKRYLGPHLQCFVSHSSSDNVRNGAASGGTTSQILISALERKLVDGALVWKVDDSADYPSVIPFVATTPEEVLSARGSKYCAVSYPKQAMPLIREFDGKLAVTTVPCDASYLRRLMKQDPSLNEKIALILTLFCGHNSTPQLTEVLLARHSTSWRDVNSFKYRTGSWRGTLSWNNSDGRATSMPTQQFTHMQNLHICSEKKCLACFDHFGFDSDISLGDAWSLDMRDREIKPTLVVTKTARGQALWEQVKDAIVHQEVGPEAVLSGNSRGMTFHYNVSARAHAGRLLGVKINDRLRLPTSILEKLIAGIAVLNFRMSQSEKFLTFLKKVPWSVIQGYVYLFKGLQELNLYFYRPFPNTEKISLIGATLAGNKGAEAMLSTTIGKIREMLPNAHFVVHSYFPEEDKALCNDLDVEIVDARPLPLVVSYLPFSMLYFLGRALCGRSLVKYLPRGPRELAESRLLIDLSGISFADGREKLLPFNVLCNLPSLLCGTSVIKLSQAMGSFKGRLNRFLARQILRSCELVVARGEKTREYCESLGLREESFICSTDIALLFEDSYSLIKEDQERVPGLLSKIASARESGKTIVALSISSVVAKQSKKRGVDYIGSLAKVLTALQESSCYVVVFPNASREHTVSLHNNDIPTIDELFAALEGQSENALAVRQNISTADIRRLLRASDCLLASRFHAMIAGLALEIPTLVIGWSHKYQEIMDMFEVGEWCSDFMELSTDELVEDIKRFMDAREEIRHKIKTHLPTVQEHAEKQFLRLKEYLIPIVDMTSEKEPVVD